MLKNVIAIAVLVILAVAVLLIFRERPSDEKKDIASAIAPVPAEKFDTIRIKRFEGRDDDAVLENVVLKKKDGVWRMAEPVDYAITEGSATRMAEALGELKVIDVISENKENHANFEVDDRHGIEVTALEGEKELAHLIVGKSKSGMTFVRIPGKDEVYRIQGYHRTAFNKSVENLRDKSVTDVDLVDVKKITFANTDQELVLERTGEGSEAGISPVGAKIKNFDETKAKNLMRSAVKMNARAFVDEDLPPEKTGLTGDAAKLVIESASSGEPETVTVWIGNDQEGKQQTYAKTSVSNQIFLIAKTTADKLKVKKDDFARTDEEVAKEEERKKKAAEAAVERGAQVPAMSGSPGTQQIPPDVMRKIQAQMAAKQQPK
jgi:hypothetical protein